MITKKGRLGVFDAGTLVGVVTASDLIKSLPDVAETEVMVDDFMTKTFILADESNIRGDDSGYDGSATDWQRHNHPQRRTLWDFY